MNDIRFATLVLNSNASQTALSLAGLQKILPTKGLGDPIIPSQKQTGSWVSTSGNTYDYFNGGNDTTSDSYYTSFNDNPGAVNSQTAITHVPW